MSMDLFAGVVRCWPVNAQCAPDWDAWAAVATAAGVLLALLGPPISRWRVRRHANALFALHFMTDVSLIWTDLKKLRKAYPLGTGTPEAWAAEALMMTDGSVRQAFWAQGKGIADRAAIDVDQSRWPAVVDMKLMAKMSLALVAARETALNVKMGAGGASNPDLWPSYFESYIGILDVAIGKCEEALLAIQKAATGDAPDILDVSAQGVMPRRRGVSVVWHLLGRAGAWLRARWGERQ